MWSNLVWAFIIRGRGIVCFHGLELSSKLLFTFPGSFNLGAASGKLGFLLLLLGQGSLLFPLFLFLLQLTSTHLFLEGFEAGVGLRTLSGEDVFLVLGLLSATWVSYVSNGKGYRIHDKGLLKLLGNLLLLLMYML